MIDIKQQAEDTVARKTVMETPSIIMSIMDNGQWFQAGKTYHKKRTQFKVRYGKKISKDDAKQVLEHKILDFFDGEKVRFIYKL